MATMTPVGTVETPAELGCRLDYREESKTHISGCIAGFRFYAERMRQLRGGQCLAAHFEETAKYLHRLQAIAVGKVTQ